LEISFTLKLIGMTFSFFYQYSAFSFLVVFSSGLHSRITELLSVYWIFLL